MEQAAHDYQLVKRILALISENWREQPSLEELSSQAGVSAEHLQRLFTRWAGLSPKAFLQAVTLDHARRLVRQTDSIMDASYELGLSGPSRLHDLFITHLGMTPGAYKSKGRGLFIDYGFHDCPFGRALIMVTGESLSGLAFADPGEERAALSDMKARWPFAIYTYDEHHTAYFARRIFDPALWLKEKPLKVTLIGTDFEIRVWQSLGRIPFGQAVSYSALAAEIGNPKAARAVGTAVGRNPVSFVVPCHRVLGKAGTLTGYHWGVTRKRAILGWETGLLAG